VQYCIFRICVPYGTLVSGAASYGTAEFMLNKAKRGEDITLYGDGSQRRTFTYMEDLVDVLVEGGLSDGCLNDVYNVGGEDLSLKEMAEMVAERYGVKVLSVPWPEISLKIESGDTVFDSSKLESVIGRLTNSTFREKILDN
jgi:UDP-glucose 4-epimerase